MRLVAFVVMLASPAMAQNLPDASYFVGTYEVVGRGANGPVEDLLSLTAQGQDLAVERCSGGAGVMVLDQSGEGPFATITVGDWDLECQWFNTWDNYPLLACYDDGRARLTLWPASEVEGCAG
jgi:hypothetical protein